MKKLLILLLLFISMSSLLSCGGGSGSSSSPIGEDPNTPFSIELRPSERIAQTNSFIYIRARVLNGNGNPIPDIPVYFMNLSPIGYLEKTLSNTDVNGFATVKLSSTTEAFVTVQAEINKGESLVRDRKTVYFSIYDLTLPTPLKPLLPYLILESSDYNLLENPGDNQVIITATVFDASDNPVPNSTVTFGADVGYKTEPNGSCSDGSKTCEVTFLLGNKKMTDSKGKASVLVEVDPAILRTLKTNLNITAAADNGAANMLTLNLEPVTIKTISVFANPKIVNSGGTSNITVQVTTSAGTPVPDNTTVNLTTTIGGIEPFSQTTNGIAEATFTAPTLAEGTADQVATIKAKVADKEGSVNVTVKAQPISITLENVLPEKVVVVGIPNPDSDPSDNVEFTIVGGVGPYRVISDYQMLIPNQNVSGTKFTVDPHSVITATDVTLTVVDAKGDSKNVTVTINPQDFFPRPLTVTIPVGGSTNFLIFGGTPPFQIFTDNPAAIVLSYSGGTSFTVVGNSAGTVKITIRNTDGRETVAQVTVK